ncbi:MAG TPA: DUF4178 domain-containing protein [Gemmatimonadaceae bacterium]|nr:DUF4178 domain-containing protein [Gemmatimonadaceae bacterium]
MTARTASCPKCGATIEFRWSAAVQTVCPYCKAVLVRHDLDLEKVGTVSDLPPTASPIQLGTEGKFGGDAFVVVGRIMYQYERGGWNEWHLLTMRGTSAWLSDAQGDLAISTPARDPGALPAAADLKVGQSYVLDDTRFRVASLTRARYAGVEGELPFTTWDRSEALFADLDSDGSGDQLRFATIDYSDDTPVAYVGTYVELEQLAARNLRRFEGW